MTYQIRPEAAGHGCTYACLFGGRRPAGQVLALGDLLMMRKQLLTLKSLAAARIEDHSSVPSRASAMQVVILFPRGLPEHHVPASRRPDERRRAPSRRNSGDDRDTAFQPASFSPRPHAGSECSQSALMPRRRAGSCWWRHGVDGRLPRHHRREPGAAGHRSVTSAEACAYSSGSSTATCWRRRPTILPGGSISDLFGRVPVIRFGLVAFGTGSVLAASAPSPVMLIAGRVVQGLGGGVFGARVPGIDQFDVRSCGPPGGHRVLDRLDRYRVRARPAAGRLGGGLPELAMDLCLVGGPDGHRFRFDVLAVPDARAQPNAPASTSPGPPCRRAGWPPPCMHSSNRANTAGPTPKSLASLFVGIARATGVRGLAAPRPAPIGAARPIRDPQFRGRQCGHGVRLRRPHHGVAGRSPSTPKRSPVTVRPSRVWPPCPAP